MGSFEVVDEHGKLQKNGGNVASYFCTPDGRVIDALTGPVGADELLAEAQWAVSAYESATAQRTEDARVLLAQAHRAAPTPTGRTSNARAIHQLLASNSLPPLSAVYRDVFGRILGQKISLPGDGIDEVAEAVAGASRQKLPILFVLHKEGDNAVTDKRWNELLAQPGSGERMAKLADSYLTVTLPLKYLPAVSQRLGIRPYAAPDKASPLFVVARSNARQLTAVTTWQKTDELARALALGLVQEAKEQPRTGGQLRQLAAIVEPVDSQLGAQVRKLLAATKPESRPHPARGEKFAMLERSVAVGGWRGQSNSSHE